MAATLRQRQDAFTPVEANELDETLVSEMTEVWFARVGLIT